MRSTTLVTALLLLCAGQARAEQSSAEGVTYRGAGAQSCATWTSTTPEAYVWGCQWVFGYWTGINAFGATGGKDVGRSTDNAGLIGEVKNLCLTHPSMSLLDATTKTFIRMKQAGQ